MVEKFVNF